MSFMDIPSIDEYIDQCLEEPLSDTNTIETLDNFFDAVDRQDSYWGTHIDVEIDTIRRHDMDGNYIDTVTLAEFWDDMAGGVEDDT
jgi:hypothetical protein